MRIGVDVLAIGELDRLHTRGWFRQYTYDRDELALAQSLSPSRAREFLAGRFAAKEAVLKVLGTGFGKGISPAQVRVLRDNRSAPVVQLGGAAARRAAELGLGTIAVSIAHKDECVVAVAIGGAPHDDAALGPARAAAATQTAVQKIARSKVGIGKARNANV
ncbi:holo-ACP synthase [Streptomyces sp. 21So2-11]|uniref:holo-ACP synthase n=1 Tax=Streptomyces sp. 21So2-11 TaxID=3144408 RepID=UPI00321BFD08